VFGYPLRVFLFGAFLSVFPAVSPAAARPSDTLLPNTTKGYVSVPDVDALRQKWDETLLGKLAKDPAMKPFVDDLRRQIQQRLSQTGVRLGVTWEDLKGVYGGEVAMAAIQPEGKKELHAIAMLVDITGHQEQADALLTKIAKHQTAKGATKKVRTVGGVNLTVFVLPKKDDQKAARQAFYFTKDNQLVAADHEGVIREILRRMTAGPAGSLSEVPAYRESMLRCAKAAGGEAAHVRWFVEPMGYLEVVRAMQGGRKRRGTDMLKVLAHQGFDAVKGLGGHVTFAAGEYEILHRTLVYAPPVERTGDDTGTDKYNLAARMLDFGQGRALAPQDWVPREVTSHLTFTWKMKDAFYHSKTLVNEIADDELFDDVLDSLRDDENGPMLDVREDVVANLGERATVITGYQLPVTPQSERIVLAIELIDPTARLEQLFDQHDANSDGKITADEVPEERRKIFAHRLRRRFDDDKDGALTKQQYVNARLVPMTLDLAMETDPDAQMIEIGDRTVWEVLYKPDQQGTKQQPLFSKWVCTVAHGHLMIATHVDFLAELLQQADPSQTLAGSADYNAVNAALTELGAGQDSLRSFSRTDEGCRAAYELIRQGKMPESEALLGKLLNQWLGPKEEGTLRKQQIDGSKLPDYQVARRYLGPEGFYVHTEENGDGWLVVGVVLGKDPPAAEPVE